MKRQAYSQFEFKSFDEETGEFEGMASTPSTDRMGDIVEPLGAEFTLPLPLLYQHRSSQPIGLVTFAKPGKNGIPVRGRVAKELLSIPWIQEAWTLIKANLIRGLSIGFMPKEMEPLNPKEPWGAQRFIKWDWMELSTVTIPANAEATILSIKSHDEEQLRAVSGARAAAPVVRLTSKAGVPVMHSTQGRNMKTFAEQIAANEAKRAASNARMSEIMQKAGDEGRTLDETEAQEYDALQAEVKAVDAHLVRLRAQEVANAAAAAPVTAVAGADPESATRARQGVIVMGKSNLPPGTAFARYAMALAASRGSKYEAIEMAKRWRDSTPEVELFLKAAVAAGTTTDANWAGPLVYATNMATEFIEFLRPMTIIGRIQGLRRVPFNIRMPSQTAGASAGWVGQGAPKPVSKLDFGTVTLGFTKTAVIIALTEELVRFSNPSAEAIVRQDLAEAIAQFSDQQFIDPDVSASGTTSPASITNGLTPVTMSGTTIAAVDTDVRALLNKFITGNIPMRAPVWIMHPRTALYLSMLRTANDVYVFPQINMNGGTFYGFPVITSANVPVDTGNDTWITLMDAAEVFLADDGGITLDTSTEASIQMNDAPDAGAQSLVSLWQNNMVGLRAERYINYKRRRDLGVGIIQDVSY